MTGPGRQRGSGGKDACGALDVPQGNQGCRYITWESKESTWRERQRMHLASGRVDLQPRVHVAAEAEDAWDKEEKRMQPWLFLGPRTLGVQRRGGTVEGWYTARVVLMEMGRDGDGVDLGLESDRGWTGRLLADLLSHFDANPLCGSATG
jgi:hypothetical protein